jgi:hypothetical protein
MIQTTPSKPGASSDTDGISGVAATLVLDEMATARSFSCRYLI